MSALKEEIRHVFREEMRAALQPDGLISWAEAAKFLGIQIRYLHTIVARPDSGLQIYRHKQGGQKYMRRSELQAYLDRIAERVDPGPCSNM